MITAANNINFVNPVNYLSPLTRGLVGFWLPGTGFDGGSTLYDLTRFNNDGTLVNGPTWRRGDRPGGFAQIEFDRINDEVRVPASSSIGNIFAGGGTISFWMRADALGENNAGRILSKTDGSNNGWSLWTGSGPTVFFQQSGSTSPGAWAIPAGSYTLGEWVFFCLTYNSDTSTNDPNIYIDGQEVSAGNSGYSGTVHDDSPDDLVMGSLDGFARHYDGGIGDLLMFDRILSPREVMELYLESANSYPTMLNRITSPVLLAPQSAGFPFIQYYAGTGTI